MLCEDLVYQLAIDELILDGHFTHAKDADDRLATAAPRATRLTENDIITSGGRNVLAELLRHL